MDLGDLADLKVLGLNSNKLTGPIPKELGRLSNLKKLELGWQQLTGPIPPQLGSLNALEHLDLGNSKLDGPIPPELGKLSALQVLNLGDMFGGGNKMTGPIPVALGSLSRLLQLSLSCNQLTGPIPPELGNLSALKYLDLGRNKLSALWDHTQDVHGAGLEEGTDSKSGGRIPSQLCRLLDVFDSTFLSVKDNPWAEPPESIVDKGAKDIRGYFEDLYADPCRIQHNSIKIILVGQEGAGKTSLRQSMKANQAAPTGEWKEESTVFADVDSMVLKGASVRV